MDYDYTIHNGYLSVCWSGVVAFFYTSNVILQTNEQNWMVNWIECMHVVFNRQIVNSAVAMYCLIQHVFFVTWSCYAAFCVCLRFDVVVLFFLPCGEYSVFHLQLSAFAFPLRRANANNSMTLQSHAFFQFNSIQYYCCFQRRSRAIARHVCTFYYYVNLDTETVNRCLDAVFLSLKPHWLAHMWILRIVLCVHKSCVLNATSCCSPFSCKLQLNFTVMIFPHLKRLRMQNG